MYEDLGYNFKDILKRIINCINEYIEKNINNPYLVESKLLLINNYVIDILNASGESQNWFNQKTILNNFQQNIDTEKSFYDLLISSRDNEEKKKIMNKLKSKYFCGKKENNEKFIHSYNDTKININNKKESSHNKYRIIKLKRKLKNEKERNRLKEFSYLQRLLDMQKDLNNYDLKKIKEEDNIYDNSNYYTINNNYFKRNLLNYKDNSYYNNSKKIKHCLSQCVNKDRINYLEKSNFNDMKLKFELYTKKTILKKNNFLKYNLEEFKKSMDKKLNKIQGINLKLPFSIKKANINNY